MKPWTTAACLLGLLFAVVSPIPAQQSSTADVEKSAERLFLEAKDFFSEQNYWQAARDLIILLDFSADYGRADEVIFALGECLYEIGLQQGSERLYKHLVTRHLRSPFQPKALLGLQRIEYDRQDYARCIDYYHVIARSHAPEPVLDASLYFAGLSHYKFRDFPKAIELLSKVSSKSPYYEYGQYNLALSQLRMKKVRKAVTILRNLSNLPVDNDETRAIVDETYRTLGYIYYELGFYRQAHSYFMAVSPNHQNHDAALLAAGWAAAEMKEYTQAIVPLTSLVTLYSHKDRAEEGLFLLGRCYLNMKKYDQAINIYDQMIRMFPEQEVIPAILDEVNTSLVDESVVIEKIRTDLLVLETNLLDQLPLNQADDAVPEHLRVEREELIASRQTLMTQIQKERQSFEELSSQMAELQELTSRRLERKDWRAYAEYGKTRALFLMSFE